MTDPVPNPLVGGEVEALRAALKVMEKARRSYVNVMRNHHPSGDSSADRRHSEGEIRASAAEAMFEEFGALTFEHVDALITATTAKLSTAEEENARLRARVEKLENLIGRIEPHIDAIVCYASTMGDHEPNRIAHEVRAIAGRTQDQLVGEAIAAQIIARIDAAHPASQEETGWLVELNGQTPSWSTLFAGDYDDHWTEDSTKAIRFARKVDAEAWIAWHGWTEAFASEHIWGDGRASIGGTNER